MAFQISETFQVQAPAERVWAYLTDPQRVVRCLPGAELLEAQDTENFRGRIRVKIGPVTTAYQGKARFVERDEAQRTIRLTGEGQESGGSGSARMTMSSEIIELPEGGSEVRVQVEMEVVGKIVQFGRGMIEEVSRQLFRQFASCVQSQLTEAAAPQVAAGAATPPQAAEGNPTSAEQETPAMAASAVAAPSPEAEPVNALQVVLRAIMDWSRRVLTLQRKERS